MYDLAGIIDSRSLQFEIPFGVEYFASQNIEGLYGSLADIVLNSCCNELLKDEHAYMIKNSQNSTRSAN